MLDERAYAIYVKSYEDKEKMKILCMQLQFWKLVTMDKDIYTWKSEMKRTDVNVKYPIY